MVNAITIYHSITHFVNNSSAIYSIDYTCVGINEILYSISLLLLFTIYQCIILKYKNGLNHDWHMLITLGYGDLTALS